MIPQSARLPRILPHSRLHARVLLPLIAALLVYRFLWRMSAGFDLRVTGVNPFAARHAGINVADSVLRAVAIRGALAGLAGAVEIQAVFHRLQADIGSDVGYTAHFHRPCRQSSPRSHAFRGLDFRRSRRGRHHDATQGVRSIASRGFASGPVHFVR